MATPAPAVLLCIVHQTGYKNKMCADTRREMHSCQYAKLKKVVRERIH